MRDLTLVFDLDGTLIDTAPDLIAATNYILSLQDLAALPPELLRPRISLGAMAMIKTALQLHRRAPPPDELNELFELFLKYYVAHIADESRPFAGILDVLQAYRRRGTKLAVCTNKRADMTLVLLKALQMEDLFDAIAGRDTFKVFKPDPGHLVQTIAAAGGSPTRAIMVGDSQTDISTADAAGIPVIGVTFGYSDPPMCELQPTEMIDSYAQFDDTVIKLLDSDVFTTNKRATNF